MAKLTLIRGVSGSGKSTLAQKLAAYGAYHLETDQYFIKDGVYQFDRNRLSAAHMWCQHTTRDYLHLGNDVIVSNTFCRKWEIQPYLDMTPDHQIIICCGRFKNVHDVPDDIVRNQMQRFEYW